MFADETLFNYEKKLDVKAGLSTPRDDTEVENCMMEKLKGVAYLKRIKANGQ